MIKLFLFIFLASVFQLIQCQNKIKQDSSSSFFSFKGGRMIYLGFEASIDKNKYSTSEVNPNHYSSNFIIGESFGLKANFSRNQNLSINTGIIRKKMSIPLWNPSRTYSLEKAMTQKDIMIYKIPLDIQMKANLVKNKLYYSFVIGHHFGLKLNNNPISESYTISNNLGSKSVSFTSEDNSARFGSMINIESGFLLMSKGKFMTQIFARYNYGTRDVITFSLLNSANYPVNSGETVSYRGEACYFGFSFLYGMSPTKN